MQCLVGLAVLFFLTPNLSHKTRASELAEQTATQIVKIFDGVRSIWLFDFLSSGPFLHKIALTITKIMEKVNNVLSVSFFFCRKTYKILSLNSLLFFVIFA